MGSNRRILAVDDEVHILELIEYNLIQNQFDVIRAESGEDALKILETEQVDLVLLDWMLGGIDGIDVLKQIRGTEGLKNLPVILLTAKSEEINKVLGLELGADDYLAKPFGVHELVARIKAVLRRSSKEQVTAKSSSEDKIEIGDLIINRTKREVKVKGMPLELSLKEFDLLFLLAKNQGMVFTRDQLLEKIWGYDFYGETRTVDVHIRNLRKKIEQYGNDLAYIKTIRGVGYKFDL